MKSVKLHISVELDDIANVRVWMIDEHTGKKKELTKGLHYTLEFVQQQTERCQVCDLSYPKSEIVKRDGGQLCPQCDLDKYPIRDEDIPF